MISLPELTVTWDVSPGHVARLALTGDVVHPNADELLRAVTELVAAHQDVRELVVDCAGLGICDSRGLSTLLMLRRRTEAAGVELRIVNRPPILDRLLVRTGTAEYLSCGEVADVQEEGG